MADFEARTVELANRLQDMTYAEWGRVRFVIDHKFEAKKEELERQLQLSTTEEDDLYFTGRLEEGR